jgi:hypothetical protein
MFWRLSPEQIRAVVEGAQDRLIREHNGRAWLAWHIAALSRVDPKKFPKITKLTISQRPREMTPDEQWRVMAAMSDTKH